MLTYLVALVAAFCVRALRVTGLAAKFVQCRGQAPRRRLAHEISPERLDQLEQNVLDLVGRLCEHIPFA